MNTAEDKNLQSYVPEPFKKEYNLGWEARKYNICPTGTETQDWMNGWIEYGISQMLS